MLLTTIMSYIYVNETEINILKANIYSIRPVFLKLPFCKINHGRVSNGPG